MGNCMARSARTESATGGIARYCPYHVTGKGDFGTRRAPRFLSGKLTIAYASRQRVVTCYSGCQIVLSRLHPPPSLMPCGHERPMMKIPACRCCTQMKPFVRRRGWVSVLLHLLAVGRMVGKSKTCSDAVPSSDAGGFHSTLRLVCIQPV